VEGQTGPKEFLKPLRLLLNKKHWRYEIRVTKKNNNHLIKWKPIHTNDTMNNAKETTNVYFGILKNSNIQLQSYKQK